MSGPRAEYESRVSSGNLQSDGDQWPAIDELERLFHDLEVAHDHGDEPPMAWTSAAARAGGSEEFLEAEDDIF